MGSSVSTIEERLALLEEAYATGALTVSMDGKSVTYRSLRELRSIIDDLRGQLGSQRPKTTVTRFRRA